MRFDRRYLIWSFGYAVAGMGLGIFMAASKNHVQHVTHAHILLVGFVVSFVYAIVHKLWLGNNAPRLLAQTQFVVHQAGALTLLTGLYLLFGNLLAPAQLDPILGVASVTVLVGVLLMLLMLFKARAVTNG